jgi:1,4-alpha-glucan branching enzyme
LKGRPPAADALFLSHMRTGFIIFFFLWLGSVIPARAQLVTTDPYFPMADQPVKVVFDATKGNGALADFEGDVYAHTGVLIQESTSTHDWKYVKTEWGENTPETRLEKIGNNLYSLSITPSIRDYYGVPVSDSITHLAFVFRNADASLQGKDSNGEDIFADVYPPGLQVRIIYPESDYILVSQGGYFTCRAVASQADSLVLLVDGSFLKGEGNTDEISAVLPTDDPGIHTLLVRASDETGTVSDSFTYLILDAPPVEERPQGIKDGVNYLSDSAVVLSIYAPGKINAFAVGDFSSWMPDTAFYLKKTPDGDHFWIRINGLDPEKIYRFNYLIDGELSLPDPNTELLLDPKYDKYISEETFPVIGSLIQGLQEQQYSIIETGRKPYQWETAEFDPPDPRDLIIYELLVRDFLEAHDWKTLTDTLDYLDRLGINAIELMPVNEFNGNESWGYNPNYWMAPDKYYGPREDLKTFIDSCHARGIAVILDIVFNHVEIQSYYSRMYEDNQGYPSTENPWLNEDQDLFDPKGYYQALHPYSVFFDFDHSSKATQDLVDRATRYWLEEYRVDGYRFDLTKGFTQRSTYLGTDAQGNAMYDEARTSSYDPQRISFLKRIADTIWTFNPEAYVILEHLCDNSEEKELADYGMMLWGKLNSQYNEATMGYHEGGKSNFNWISYKIRGWNDPRLVGYMESHDEERLMYKNLAYGNSEGDYNIQELSTALERMQLAGAFFFTIPGPKLIWQFGVLGYDYSIDTDCRTCNKPIRWDYYSQPDRKALYDTWSALIRLRNSYPSVFRSEDFTLYVSGPWKRIEIDDPEMDIRIIGNFDVVPLTVNPSFSHTGTWFDFFSGKEVEVTDTEREVVLMPGQFHIFTSKRVFTPEISREEPVFTDSSESLELYPNPAGDAVYVNRIEEASRFTFTDMQGRVVAEAILGEWENRIDVSFLPEGLYVVCRHSDARGDEFSKLLKIRPN